MVLAPSVSSPEKRLRCISMATEKIAKVLRLNVEVVTRGGESAPIYVYYKSGDEDPIPIYCDQGKSPTDPREVCASMRNMMFVLSFHPKHSALKQARKEIMLFS
jgi:hypothetical protein